MDEMNRGRHEPGGEERREAIAPSSPDHAQEGVRERARERTEQMARRASRTANRQKTRVAGRMDRLGERLKERGRTLEPEGGVRQRAGMLATRTGDAMQRGASYLRARELEDMRSDLETQVREHPLASLGAVAGLGFLIGRIVR